MSNFIVTLLVLNFGKFYTFRFFNFGKFYTVIRKFYTFRFLEIFETLIDIDVSSAKKTNV
jgi:hypothetical protein